VSSIENISF